MRKVKGWICKTIEMPYTNEKDKKLKEQTLDMLKNSIEGVIMQNFHKDVGGGFKLRNLV